MDHERLGIGGGELAEADFAASRRGDSGRGFNRQPTTALKIGENVRVFGANDAGDSLHEA